MLLNILKIFSISNVDNIYILYLYNTYEIILQLAIAFALILSLFMSVSSPVARHAAHSAPGRCRSGAGPVTGRRVPGHRPRPPSRPVVLVPWRLLSTLVPDTSVLH